MQCPGPPNCWEGQCISLSTGNQVNKVNFVLLLLEQALPWDKFIPSSSGRSQFGACAAIYKPRLDSGFAALRCEDRVQLGRLTYTHLATVSYTYWHNSVHTRWLRPPCAEHKHDMKCIRFMNTVAFVMNIVQDFHQRFHNDNLFCQNICMDLSWVLLEFRT